MSSRVLTRVLLTALVGALCGVVVACVLVVAGDGGGRDLDGVERSAATVPAASAATRAGGPREVLRRWDAARARAWTAADDDALARLYTPASVAGRRDVAMLRSWTARGLRVTKLTTQVLRLQVLVERDRRIVLVVTDRVAVAEAGDVRLPDDRESTRRVELRRVGAAWRVAAVSPARPARS